MIEGTDKTHKIPLCTERRVARSFSGSWNFSEYFKEQYIFKVPPLRFSYYFFCII